ncbi:YcxB family protein [Rapidithrix thailandica]|uniref:YcxB family protein n=1 Tax=Rapidithrix thailandica TaxID=413964 RepID=A0AAW9S412_9BACT
MIIKTKKYKLDPNKYVMLGLKTVMKEYWWAWLVPVAIMFIPLFAASALWWCFGIALTLSILYVLFWLVQFAGASQMEQNKILFQKLGYEIDSRQVMIKLNARQGMPITWDKVQKVEKSKKHYLLVIAKGQFVYLPFEIFRTENDLKFMDTILRRKNLLK